MDSKDLKYGAVVSQPLTSAPLVVQNTVMKAFSSGGKTGHSGDVAAPPESLSPYLGGGTYQEATLKNAINYMKGLKGQVSSGQLSQSQYVDELNKIVPDLKSWTFSVANSGSRYADAMKSQGYREFWDQLVPEYNALSQGRQMLGRDLTPEELAQAIPQYSSAENDWNETKSNTNGNAWMANYAQQYKQTPEYLRTQAGQYSGQVNDLFNQLLGRQATGNEADYFGQELATKAITPYQIEQQIKQGQEYTNAANAKFRQGLAGELQGYDKQFFNEVSPTITSNMMNQMGGSGTSSALNTALTQLMGQISQNRGSYLANLSASQYGGSQENARQDYLSSMDQYLNNIYGNRAQNQNQMGYYQQRQAQQSDYAQQMSDYMNYLNSQKHKQSNGMGGAFGSLAGGIAGLAMTGGNPMGGMVGSQMGGSAGNIYDYLRY